MTLVKGNVRIGVLTRFGPNWPGKRCLAKTRQGTACQRAAYKHNGRCMVGAQLDLRLSGAYSASQRPISSTDDRRRIS